MQTTRLATQPLSHLPGEPLVLAADLWPRCEKAGFDYLSLGPILADSPGADLTLLDAIPDLIRATEVVFAGVLVARHGQGINLDAIQRTARAVRSIAHTTGLGFGNLRLAMLANVGPHAPFFPAAYHDGGPPALAIATESADLAVDRLFRGPYPGGSAGAAGGSGRGSCSNNDQRDPASGPGPRLSFCWH